MWKNRGTPLTLGVGAVAGYVEESGRPVARTNVKAETEKRFTLRSSNLLDYNDLSCAYPHRCMEIFENDHIKVGLDPHLMVEKSGRVASCLSAGLGLRPGAVRPSGLVNRS